ncbi:MAG: hypothetical protein JSW21_00020 [Gammaproteobacteria bacterium]|nr:MAG: hypothetical protein JSW21_00020 [Gammaproteobacteria bacterium]
MTSYRSKGGQKGPGWSEDELALEFSADHANLRWVQGWSRWFEWNDVVWVQDNTLHVYDMIRDFLREKSSKYDRPSELRRASTVAAVEKLARSDRRYAATTDQWDVDSMLLNCPNGVIDLSVSTLVEPRLDRYMTKLTGVEAEFADCPRWLSFLKDITRGDDDLISFLQRMIGYCLTGDPREHALFFLYGSGANGKSTFLNVITHVLGDYATDAPIEAFTVSNTDRHPTELAMLRGARLVTAVETEEGRRWAESRIKQLTGGDRVTARLMRQDFFTYRPQFKLLFAGNHRPRLQAVDEAMRRRFHLIPFEASFKGSQCIKDMEARLLEEGPAILAWAVEGCRIWQEEGLNPPDVVREATEDYFANQDVLGEWLVDSCETGPDYWETPTRLFNSWRAYANEAGIPVGNRASFNDRLEAAGFRRRRDRRRRSWVGIKLKPEAENTYRDWTEVQA